MRPHIFAGYSPPLVWHWRTTIRAKTSLGWYTFSGPGGGRGYGEKTFYPNNDWQSHPLKILHARDKISDMAPRHDPAYNSILKRLQEAWQEYDSTARSVKISSNIFCISDETSYLSQVAVEGRAMLALEMVKI